MPLIIDANVANEFVRISADSAPVVKAVINGKIKCVSGQKHKLEMMSCAFRSMYRQLLLAGKLVEYTDTEINDCEALLPQIVSDDPHVLALAIVSGARVLFSRDANLHADFRNSAIINDPRGHIYQKAEHKHLLTPQYCNC